jgi:hypothetical protein
MKIMQNPGKPTTLFALLAMLLLPQFPLAAEESITVWKSPTCGCCQGWVDYLEDNGFKVAVNETDAMNEIKRNLGITDPTLHSCHTAKVGDYLVEGHVPVSDIRRLLEEKPEIMGITAPGMPMDSPGMRSIEPSGYDVLQFDQQQRTALFSRY